MRKYAASAVIALTLAMAPGVSAEELPRILQSGSYEVEVNLILPHIENVAANRTMTLCIRESNSAGVGGLTVLSANNPFAGCPASNIKQAGNTLAFDIVCTGSNSAKAKATYLLEPQQFQGRIAMTMGGKNMTMTETQNGRRVGDCPPSGAPRS